MERGVERFAGMVVVPDLFGVLVRWLVGRAMNPDVKPRFQALPGPKPVLGLGASRPRAFLGGRYGGRLRLARRSAVGHPRLRRPGHPGR